MVLVLKTSERKFRGFESHPLRHFVRHLDGTDLGFGEVLKRLKRTVC